MSKGKHSRRRAQQLEEQLKAQQMRVEANARRLGKKLEPKASSSWASLDLSNVSVTLDADAVAREMEQTMKRLREMMVPKVEPRTGPAPVFTSCIVGYRAWTVDAFGDLRPVTKTGWPWTPGVNTAKCTHQDGENLTTPGHVWMTFTTSSLWGAPQKPQAPKEHKAPHEHCGCGLYARFTPAVTDGDHGIDPRAGSPVLLGAIAAWGDIEVHRSGFRAEHAQVTALALHPSSVGMPGWERLHALAQTVAHRYGVPLVDAGDLVLEGELHGEPLPKSAIPDHDHIRWIA